MNWELALAYQVLTSTVCQCRRTKSVHLAVCERCWKRLPVAERNALYRRVGEGFGAAYETACRLLGRQADQLELGI
jgi:hypothetical protein